MFIKLGIIFGVMVLGGVIFFNEIDTVCPTAFSTLFEFFNDNMTSFGSETTDFVEQKMNESINKITNKTSNVLTNEINEAGDKVTNEILN